ncbi:MAG: transposase family protein, partial [Endomicrobium sp.]|nr:transposase family protein [Endomicrobium sp.]
MLKIVKREYRKKRKRGGRKSKLEVEEMLLMTLEYWREYRTYFHIGINYGV